MKNLANESDVDVTDAVKKLETKIVKLKKDTYKNLTRWQRVQLSRHPDRPYTLDYIYELSKEFVELHGDRAVKDDKAMVGGLGKIDGKTYMIIGQQKGYLSLIYIISSLRTKLQLHFTGNLGFLFDFYRLKSSECVYRR